MIKSFTVRKLHNKTDHQLNFNPDFSLLTGRNGAGKTAIIKLAWYLISGNIERTIKEVNFSFVEVVTDTCRVSIACTGFEPHSKVSVTGEIAGAKKPLRFECVRGDWNARSSEIDAVNSAIARSTGNSLFFPTFRRIEGGFATTEDLLDPRRQPTRELKIALDSYVNAVSVYNHHFVATLSTNDINRLLTEKFANASRETDEIHRELYGSLKERIETFYKLPSHPRPSVRTYRQTLSELTKLLESAESRRTKALERFTQLGEIVRSVFTHKGIKLTNTVSFGDTENAVSSDLLSAGEKQLFSFLCYNAFLSDSVIFIDEPEISLHPDWQRRLIPILKSQQSSNQFILTTHSPFIYAKYPDREFTLSEDRGE